MLVTECEASNINDSQTRSTGYRDETAACGAGTRDALWCKSLGLRAEKAHLVKGRQLLDEVVSAGRGRSH